MALLGPPTITFCEDNLKGVFAQPANSLSSFTIALVGALLWRVSCSPLQRWLCITAIVTGAGSGVYHASYTYLGQILDNAGMFLLAAVLLYARSKHLAARPIIATATGALAVMLLTVEITGKNPNTFLFGSMLCVAIVRELTVRTSHTWYWAALATFALGLVVWWLDLSGIWCNPATFHIVNGHALWHLLNAAAIGLLWKHYTPHKA